MFSAEDLLKPISEAEPCGIDLSYDPALQELEVLARGKPETQFSSAEAPDWKELRTRCLHLFSQSKDLRVAVTLSVALLVLEGLPSFRESLALIHGLLTKFWNSIHPQLEPADDNDPLQRMNIIATLATPLGTYGDPLRVIEHLRAAPLCSSIQMGRHSYSDILHAEAGDSQGSTTPAQIEAAFRDSDPEKIGEIYRALGESIQITEEMDEFLTATVGASQAPDLSPLVNELKGIRKRIARFVSFTQAVTMNEPVESSAADTPARNAPAPGTPISGEIRSRADVIKMIEKICSYYSQYEPSSPVPLILRRAARIAEMDFMQIIQDLSPDAIPQIRGITGESEQS